MDKTSTGISLLLVASAITLVTAQIYFPDETFYPEPQSAKRVPVRAIKPDELVSDLTIGGGNAFQRNTADVIARGFTQMILDINRIAPSISPQLAKANNVVYGPVTIAAALALILLGSVGKTFSEIANSLGFTQLGIQDNPLYIQEQIGQLFARMESSSVVGIGQTVRFAAGIFVQRDFPIRPSYQQIVETYYRSNIMNLDFERNAEMAQNVINTWVSGRTNGKIPILLDEPPPPNTQAIIASVLYFQAAWEYPFFEGHTKPRPFYVNGRKKPSDRMAEMMSNGGEFPYYKDRTLNVEIMGFPYKHGRTTMYVIIPNDSDKEKLKQLENSLTAADIDRLVNSVQYTEAVILFPKMKLETTINLRPVLQMMGVNAMFDPNKANLALLSPGTKQNFNTGNRVEAPFVSATVPEHIYNSLIRPQSTPRAPSPTPAAPPQDLADRLIFTRFGGIPTCVPVYNPITNTTNCLQTNTAEQYKQRQAVPLTVRARNVSPMETLENIRQQVNRNPDLANPGLYADQVIHKVFIDITESGTEAASATGISLNRSGGRITFRVDIPFLFFIYHEETKIVLFWGSVKSPTPSVVTRST